MRGLCVTSSLKVRTLSYREDLQTSNLVIALVLSEEANLYPEEGYQYETCQKTYMSSI